MRRRRGRVVASAQVIPDASRMMMVFARSCVADVVEGEPRCQGAQFGLDRGGYGASEGDVVVHSVYLQQRRLTVDRAVDLADEPVKVEHRKGEVSPPSFPLRLVHLEGVLEVEQSTARTRSWISRSNGDSNAVRPSKPSAVASGSTRQGPEVPSISTGMPASPTTCGRATPRERSHFSSRILRASPAGTSAVLAGYTRSARSHTRCRPRRPATATSPR